MPDILIQAGVLPAADAHSQGGIAEVLERLDQTAPLVNGGGAKIAAEPSTGSA